MKSDTLKKLAKPAFVSLASLALVMGSLSVFAPKASADEGREDGGYYRGYRGDDWDGGRRYYRDYRGDYRGYGEDWGYGDGGE